MRSRLLYCLSLLMLISCATNTLITNPDSTHTSTAAFGMMHGGWNRAQGDAVNKAVAFCNARDLSYVFISEKQDGSPGWTPLSSSITFKCAPNVNELLKSAQRICESDMESAELNIIREKVELLRGSDASVPFNIASNNSRPTLSEARVIAKWASLRDNCNKRYEVIFTSNPPTGNQLQIANEYKLRSFTTQLITKVDELVVSLYQGKLTFGEFAQKRAEFSRQIASAGRDFHASLLLADRDMQIRRQQIAEQQLATSLSA